MGYTKMHCFVEPHTGRTRAVIGRYAQSDCKDKPYFKKQGGRCYTKTDREAHEWPRYKYVCILKGNEELRSSPTMQEENTGPGNVDSMIAIFLIVFVIGIGFGYLLYTKR